MIFSVVILSILQGITEFLPISSSGHLLLFPWIFNLPNPGLAFDAAIHVGTALALVIFFWKDFYNLIKKRDKLLLYILIASVPAALAGFFGDKLIEEYLHQGTIAPLIVGLGIIFFGGLMYYIDHNAKLDKDLGHIGKKRALFIGLAQVLALIPGTSRSGITITAGEFLGLNRESAARFSFLLATPISLGAGLYKLTQIINEPNGGVSIWLVLLGIIIAFITGMIVIKWLLDFLKKHSLLVFVWYRFILGSLIVALWLVRA
jgi:undecaprenyl-diphosphatase